MEAHDWIPLVGVGLALAAGLAAMIRYVDTQLSDKISIGEYDRRHEDLERRLRNVERWQDRVNGRLIGDSVRGLRDEKD